MTFYIFSGHAQFDLDAVRFIRMVDDGAGTAQGGVFAKTAVACAYIDFGGGGFVQLETERDASKQATEYVCSLKCGVIEVMDTFGVYMTSDVS